MPHGGYASVGGGSFVNYGTVTTTVQDVHNKVANFTQFYGELSNARGGTVVDKSGLLQVNSISNEGTLAVAAGASIDLVAPSPGGLASGVFTNSGTIDNGGIISAQAGTWSQLGVHQPAGRQHCARDRRPNQCWAVRDGFSLL